MIPEPLVSSVASWLLTYLVHSMLLMASVILVTRFARAPSWQDTLWKVALVGGFVTATVQSATSLRPSFAGIALPASALIVEGRETGGAPVSSQTDRAAGYVPTAFPVEGAEQGPELREPRASSTPTGSPLGTALLLWVTIAGLLLARLAAREIRLRSVLADRQQIRAPAIAEMLAELRCNAGILRPVWLSSSSRCPTPLAFGASEICVPDRFIHDLTLEEQRAALAHELAHVARRDPQWHLAAGIIESLMFFQPLNRLGRRRLREAAEYMCDDWAVKQIGSATGLARCLAAVAAWVVPDGEAIPASTMAMAEGGSPLLARVRRLLEGRSHVAASGFARGMAATAIIAATIAAAPFVGPASGSAPSEPVIESVLVPNPTTGATLAQASPAPAQRHEIVPPGSTVSPKVESPLLPDTTWREPILDTSAVAGDLMRSAIEDPDAGVRRAAAEALGNLHPRLAAPALNRVIWRSRDQSVQVEAVEALGELGTTNALVSLDAIAWRHPSKSVALKAVEAMTDVGTRAAALKLSAIARGHPDPRMRREAIEELDDMDVSEWSNSNRNFDPGNFNPGNSNPGNFNPGNR